MNEKRAEAKKTIDKRTNELKKDKVAKADYIKDTIYKDAANELYELLKGKLDPISGKYEGGIVDAEAELRTLKKNLAKLK